MAQPRLILFILVEFFFKTVESQEEGKSSTIWKFGLGSSLPIMIDRRLMFKGWSSID